MHVLTGAVKSPCGYPGTKRQVYYDGRPDLGFKSVPETVETFKKLRPGVLSRPV